MSFLIHCFLPLLFFLDLSLKLNILGVEFPPTFLQTIRQMFKYLFRIFTHIYHTHYDKIIHTNAEGHLNTLFTHFVCFAREFDLLDKKEYAPMSEMIDSFESMGLLR